MQSQTQKQKGVGQSPAREARNLVGQAEADLANCHVRSCSGVHRGTQSTLSMNGF